MKNLKNLKKLADMHFAQYENVMSVLAAETEKANTRNYKTKLEFAKQSANAEQEYENINYELQGFESNINPFEDMEENEAVPFRPLVVYVPRHITMVERLQMDKANGIVYTPLAESIECTLHEY